GYATILQYQGQFAEAETNYLEALVIQKKVLGDHRETAITLNQYGTFLRQQNRLAEAEIQLRQAAGMEKKVFEDGSTLNALEKLKDVLVRQGKQAEAELVLREAVAIRKKTLGDHRDTATVLIWLAGTLKDADEARRLEREALEIRRKVL